MFDKAGEVWVFFTFVKTLIKIPEGNTVFK